MELIRSERVFQGRAFAVRVDQLRRPDGQITRIDLVEHVGAVALLPLGQDGLIWFVRQYRHPAGKRLLELPAGTLEPGEPPEECARRECREEIGMAPGRLERLGGFYLAPGYSTEYLHVFLAADLQPSPLPGDEDEELEIERLGLEQALQRMRRGEIEDAKSLAALLLGLPLLQSEA
jgi:ADP-ribose pyrophosphatase